VTGVDYDSIGQGYTETRRPDPRIAAVIWRALGDARNVLNVGAGAGAYEPEDRDVLAVEPSAVMIAQRPLPDRSTSARRQHRPACPLRLHGSRRRREHRVPSPRRGGERRDRALRPHRRPTTWPGRNPHRTHAQGQSRPPDRLRRHRLGRGSTFANASERSRWMLPVRCAAEARSRARCQPPGLRRIRHSGTPLKPAASVPARTSRRPPGTLQAAVIGEVTPGRCAALWQVGGSRWARSRANRRHGPIHGDSGLDSALGRVRGPRQDLTRSEVPPKPSSAGRRGPRASLRHESARA